MKRKAPGILPSQAWLMRNGFHALVTVMSRHQKAFAHITQRKLHKTLAQWVSLAEYLAKENHGQLPTPKLLAKKFSGLYQIIHREPTAFRHLSQERKRKQQQFHTLKQYVSMAKDLVRKYDEVPHCCWLYKHGYGNLYQAMQDNPTNFANIKRAEKGRGPDTSRRPEDRVKEAETIAKDAGGILPTRAWLFRNGRGAVWHAMNRHPELFSHIQKRETSYLSVERWLPVAERLVRENNDILPSYTHLKHNGCRRIIDTMKAHPEAFAHIKQKRLRK